MLKIFARAALAATFMATAGTAYAEKIKVGMITTLSGGGAGLGIDVRDGFVLALKQAGNADIELVVEDDQQKPDIAVQLADKMIQSEKVDVLTGIIWSNLAMAVVPAATAQGVFYLSPNAGPSQLAGKGCHPIVFQRGVAERQPARGCGCICQAGRLCENLRGGSELPSR